MSLATDAARDVDGRDIGKGGLGLGTLLGGCADTGVMGGGAVPDAFTPLRFWLMMFVSSVLNFSRSVTATTCGARNVKLCPASSDTSPSFSLTCAAPSLLQKRAWTAVNTARLMNEGRLQLTCGFSVRYFY